MLNESGAHSITTAIKCFELYALNNSAQAYFKQEKYILLMSMDYKITQKLILT